MAYYHLPSNKLKNKLESTVKLKNMSQNFGAEFYVSPPDQIDSSFQFNFQRNLISKTHNTNDVQKYLLASGDFVKHMREDIDLFVSNYKFSNASARHNFDLLYKNILQRQSQLELVF